VPPDFLTLSVDQTVPQPTQGLLARPAATDILKSQGVTFAEGDSAMFNPVTSQLIVTGTQRDLDLVEAMVDSINRQSALQPQAAIKAGLMPLDLELPTSGILLRFHGAQSPEPLKLSFTAWERQLAMAVLWILLGAAAFVRWGRKRVVWRTLFVMLILLAGVPLLIPTWQTAAHGLLAGWLGALAAWWLWRMAIQLPRFTPTTVREEVVA
jgi:hypothetical protein